LLLTAPDKAEPATQGLPAAAEPEPLTEAEAIAEFERLHAAMILAGRKRDATVFDEIFTSRGPIRKRAQSQVDRLVKDEVRDLSRWSLLEVSLTSSSSTRITLATTSELSPCFVTGKGRDITEGRTVVQQSAVWTLLKEDGKWLIHEGKIEQQQATKGRRDPCP
jgi:hypothetical protein